MYGAFFCATALSNDSLSTITCFLLQSNRLDEMQAIRNRTCVYSCIALRRIASHNVTACRSLPYDVATK